MTEKDLKRTKKHQNFKSYETDMVTYGSVCNVSIFKKQARTAALTLIIDARQ